MFPKFKGERLQRALPAVREMYEGARAPEHRAGIAGSFLHLRYHTFPYHGFDAAIRMGFIACLMAFWFSFATIGLQLRCLTAAVLYSFMEWGFTLLERGAGYTSVAQFVANILYTPVLLDLYGTLLADKPLLYVLLFPCNVWWLEVVVAYVLIWLYGHNVAWCYDDYSDAFCHASFRLGHGLFWLGLGAICLHLYPLLIETTDSAAAWVEAELSLQGHDAKWL